MGQAVTVRGNDHLIELNELFNVGYDEGDGGAIYATNSSLATLTRSVVCGNTLEQLSGPVEFGLTTCVQESCAACPPVTCTGDLDGDAIVDGADLTLLLGEWGQAQSYADITEDGLVDGADLAALLGAWGACP